MPPFSTYDNWKLRSPDDERGLDEYDEPFPEEEFEPEPFPIECDDLEFLAAD